MDGLQRLGKERPDLDYFRQVVAKAILFRRCQKIVGDSDIEANRANVVTYTAALLVAQTASQLDLETIWNTQDLPEPVARTLAQ